MKELDNLFLIHVPKHEIIEENELPSNIVKKKLPKIFINDIGARSCNAKEGDILLIYRKNGKKYYRQVVI
jgi:DNA-directed RNA polymerase subunit H (RpoH/RPB5)